MKETGMLFNAEMVRALLDGRKTQTRRQFSKKMLETFKIAALAGEVSNFIEEGKLGKNDLSYILAFSPFGKVGDRIWVRETFADIGARLSYRADKDDGAHCKVKRWVPSLHMPRTASRILLEITEVRIERLQDIRMSDAIAEGVTPYHVRQINLFGASKMHRDQMYRNSVMEPFKELWESTGGDWNANPWVWVYEFKPLETGAA